MNTVGRPGRLGEQIRCVVSVSMLTEGWDTNTVTHILGVRAFGTQLLCEQVVGRGLRRQSYDLNPETGLFDVEYADIMGIPFDFAASPQVATPTTPKPVTRVHAIKERAALEIGFPRVSGYRRDLPSEKLEAVFTDDSRLEITPADIGPTSVVMEGIVGAGVTITPQVLERLRPSEISFNLAKHLLYTSFRDEDGFPKQHLFPQIQRLARRWLDEGYLVTKGVPVGAILYQDQLARAAEKIDIACTRASEGRIIVVLDPYNAKGSTRHVNFITSKPCWKTGAQPPRSQISHVVLDSDWEEPLAQTLETHPRVLAYAKNQAMVTVRHRPQGLALGAEIGTPRAASFPCGS
jgi:type III restriction enzyme